MPLQDGTDNAVPRVVATVLSGALEEPFPGTAGVVRPASQSLPQRVTAGKWPEPMLAMARSCICNLSSSLHIEHRQAARLSTGSYRRDTPCTIGKYASSWCPLPWSLGALWHPESQNPNAQRGERPQTRIHILGTPDSIARN